MTTAPTEHGQNTSAAILCYRRNPQTAGRVVDGLAFIVTPENNTLHTLNQTATLLWSLASEGVTPPQAAQALVADFEVDLKTAEHDARSCLEDLVDLSILVRIG